MKRFVWFLMSAATALIGVLIVACEKHKDPFSAQNKQPLIAVFRFKSDPDLPSNAFQDSLRFKPGKTFKLRLEYEDQEFRDSDTRKLQAVFSFESGSGKISHDKFSKPSADGLTFGEVPGKFGDDLLFIPDAPGVVRLRLQLFDGVKLSDMQQASATIIENLKPIPVFKFDLRNQTQPYKVEFDPRDSRDRDGNIAKATFVWNFGDSSPDSVGVGPSLITHDYKQAGQYRVRLRVVDEEGKADSTEKFVTTNNQAPRALLSVFPVEGKVPLEITYNARGSFDTDGMISSYQLIFGDGESALSDSGKHIYKTDKDYKVLLIVKDNLGLAGRDSVIVSVKTYPVAVLKITPETGGPVPLRLTISGKASYDPHPGGSIVAADSTIIITNLTTGSQPLVFPQDSVTTLLMTPGNYQIVLVVKNNRNLRTRATKVIAAGLP